MSILTSGDSFSSTLDNLKTTLQDFGPLVTPIDDVTTILSDIDKLLVDIGDLISAANDIDDVLMALGEVLEFLDPIPIVGEIAEVMSAGIETVADVFKDAITTAQQINNDSIKPMAAALQDITTGLSDFRQVIVDISQKVPGYINTVEILSYLSQIAAPLTQVLQGTDPGTKLQTLLDDFNQAQDDVGTAISQLNPIISAVKTAVQDLTGALGSIQQALGSNVGNVLSGIQGAANALAPINNGFRRMEEAIKPLAWVLDALSWIFDEVLKPVINFIMHATGLDTVVQSAEQSIFQKIGIGPIMNASQSSLSQNNISQEHNATGASQGADSQRFWNAAETALAQYRSGNDGGTKAAVWAVISAITNTPIDPGIPSKAPPFPAPLPSITAAQDAGTGNTGFSRRNITATALPLHASILSNLKKPPVRPYTMPITVAAAPGDAPAPLPVVDPKTWPCTSAFINSCNELSTQLATLAPDAARLQGSLSQLGSSLQLPETFYQQTNDLSQLFTDAVNILDFLGSLNIAFLTTLVQPFDSIAHDQNTKLSYLLTQLPALKNAMQELESSSQGVIGSFPDSTIIDQTIHRVEGWSISIGQLVQLVELLKQQSASQGNAQAAAIAAFASQVENIATALSARQNNIANEIKVLSTAIDSILAGLGIYTEQLEIITTHSTLLSAKALPVASQAVHILDIVNSVIDPLSGLLQAENCIDAASPWKIYGATAKDAINAAGQAAITKQPQAFVSFAEGLAEQALPLTTIASAIQTASTTITSGTVTAFQNQSANLVNGLTTLSGELLQSASYTTTIPDRKGGTQTITVTNDFITQDLLTQAYALINSLKPPSPGN